MNEEIRHPDAVFAALKAKANARKQRHLTVLHTLLREQQAQGQVQFTYAYVGRLSGDRGGPKLQTIRNKAGEDYRTLIEAWRVYARKGRVTSDAESKVVADETVLQDIDNPRLRAHMGFIVSERNQLRREVHLLRAHAKITVDMRPLPGVGRVDGKNVIQVLEPTAHFTESELEALRAALSPAFLEQQHWAEDADGRIVDLSTSKRRVLFQVGFTHAIRKILSEQVKETPGP